MKDCVFPNELSDTVESLIYLGGKGTSIVGREQAENIIDKFSKVDTYRPIDYYDSYQHLHDPWVYGR